MLNPSQRQRLPHRTPAAGARVENDRADRTARAAAPRTRRNTVSAVGSLVALPRACRRPRSPQILPTAPNPRRVRAEPVPLARAGGAAGGGGGPFHTRVSPATGAHCPVVDPEPSQIPSTASLSARQEPREVFPRKKKEKKEKLHSRQKLLAMVRLFVAMVGLAACVCGQSGREPPDKPGKPKALADLGPNFQWNCHTAGGGNCHTHPRPNCARHAGHCAKINRTQASFELIDALDIGVVTDFLPDAPARAILEQMKTLPDRCAGVCAQAERG